MASFNTLVKTALSEHKVACINLIYVVVLIWFHEAIFNLYQAYGFVSSTIGILLLPSALYFWGLLKGKDQKLPEEPLFTAKSLTEQQVYLLKKHTPTAQLTLMQEILMVSLELLHDVLTQVKLDQGTLFDQKFEQVLKLLKSLKADNSFTSNDISKRSYKNALLCFAFYRILFADVLAKAKASQIVHQDIDPWILLKRIPGRMSEFLGAESWRVFELKCLLFGGLEALEINADIKAAMLELCNGVLPSEVVKKTPEKSIKNKPEKTKNSEAGAEVNKTDAVKTQKTSEPTIENDSQPMPVKQNKGNASARKFEKWIARKLSRHKINESGELYFDPDSSDTGLLVSENLVKEFGLRVLQSSLESAKDQLVSAKLMSKACFEIEGEEGRQFFSIKIEIPIEGNLKLDKKVTRRAS